MSELIFANQAVVYSDFSLRRLNTLGINNVTRIDVGIEVERWAHAQPDSGLRQRLGVTEEAVLILFAGEYARLGSVTVLKHIMPSVINRHPRAHFLIACRILSPTDLAVEAELRQMVQAHRLEQRVHFLGEVADFAALLHASDIFFFPVTEMAGKIDTPLTILEAMAAGLPILTRDLRPLNEIEGLTDLSLATDDNALLERLSQLVSNPALRRDVGSYGQSRVQQQYGLTRMVDAYEALYDSFA
jgi:glycosyltransferase involved in cell wall biosynthesis